MTWAETSSPADLDLPPLAPACADEPSAPHQGDEVSMPTDLVDEIGSWTEPPVAVADDRGLSAMGERAQALGYLWVELAPPGPEYRGRLGLYIEEGLETRLDQLGAPPAGIHASTSLDASLSDQLYRARFVERRGLALGIPNLEGIANLGRTLDADDSSVLRWWVAATADRPVRLVVSTQNQFLRVYPSPVLFDSLFELVAEPVSPRAPSVSLAESAAAMDLSDLPPAVAPVLPVAGDSEALAAGESFDDPMDETGLEASPSQPPEPTTDVLGTRVAPLFDVALPGLDRALGLLPDEPVAPAALAEVEPEPSLEASCEADLLAIERARREAITLIPPPDEPSLAHDLLASELLTPQVALTVDAPEARPVPSFGPAVAASAPPALDAEEFLRVLEADSCPPPTAELAPSAPEPEAARDAEALNVPTPLPEKKLRRPFLRMAVDEPTEGDALDRREPASVPEATAEKASVHVQPARPEPIAVAERPPAAASAGAAPRMPALDPNDPFNQLAQKEWRTWRDALAQAAGPRPLAAIERMFVTDYTRLAEATRRGIADDTAKAVLNEWQGSFQKSYAETFDALRVRGKRPTMVLDLPDIAQRLGRLQGARRVQLLLIDGLRFDLGLMVQERLRAKVDAALTERLLLWSALPSTTTVQLELLGKGPEGLLERFATEEPPTLVARGRAARTPRRIRTGRVEVQKIDVVEDALRTLGRPVVERFDDIAAETADAIAEHMSAQQARTLVVVFGDHGFRLDPARAGTTEEVRQGGSSPEEVLVPAFAWLTGAVH
jgi:hypothetical protein